MNPTAAQIEAAAKAIYEMVGYDMRVEPGCHNLPLRAAAAALTAAAQVGEPSWEPPFELQYSAKGIVRERNATIERCALVAKAFSKDAAASILMLLDDPQQSKAAIRKLKDES